MKAICVYLDEVEKELLKEASARTGMTTSAFCRYAALSLARRVLRGRKRKRVGPESVSKYITQELRKGRKLQEILKDVEDCQFCIYCGEPIW